MRPVLVDQAGRVVTTDHAVADSNVLAYRSDGWETDAQVSTAQSSLVYLKGTVKSSATDDTTFFIHVLDAASAPSEDDPVDPITTLVVNHNAGFEDVFETAAGRAFVGCDDGLLVALSTDRFTYDQDGLAADDELYLEVDYLEA